VTGEFPAALWGQLAELGVFGLCTPEGDGGAPELVAAAESLGRAVFPGPLAATFLATQLLGDEKGQRAAVADGKAVVSLGAAPLMPWAPHAQIFIEIVDGRAWSCRPAGAIVPLQTLGGEPWGRVALERERDLGDASAALALYETFLAAYLAAAGIRLIDDASEHARTRVQFGKAIGEFQGVALPLAECRLRLDAAQGLARAAAYQIDLDADAPSARVAAAAARLSAVAAAVHAVHVGHQSFGALGITLEGPVFHITRRIRQLASQPPGPEAAREALLAELGL
jgi:alkylation response protein AidB-like acyl-CoA dehydrogenase